MAVFDHFSINSDYTTLKETHSFDETLSIPAQSLGGGESTSKVLDITVPDGTYIENTTITLSLANESCPVPFINYTKTAGDGLYQVLTTLRKTTTNNYQIFVLINNTASTSVNIPAFTVRVRTHLLVYTPD